MVEGKLAGFNSVFNPTVRSNQVDLSQSFVRARRRDTNINIGRRSSFERSDRVGGRDGRDSYRFELTRSSVVSINVRNRDFLLAPSINVQLQKRGRSGRIDRTAFPGGLALINRRLSSGTYTLRISSNTRGESVRYRLNYRRRTDNFDPFN